MDFRLTEEQLALQETLRRFIAKDYDFERRRSLARSPLGYSSEAWAQYAELGLLGLPYPEEFGASAATGWTSWRSWNSSARDCCWSLT